VISISVFYASIDKQKEITLSVEENCSVKLAIIRSGIMAIFPEIDFSAIHVGIYSKRVTLDAVVKAGDRIEIYRPLLLDPKEQRRKRVNTKSMSAASENI